MSYELKISELPKGVRMEKGVLTARPDTKGTVVIYVQKSSDLMIRAEQNSHLKVVVFQNANGKSDIEFNVTTRADESARIDFLQFHLGGAKVHASLISETYGPNAELNTDLLSRAQKDQKHQFLLNNNFVHKNGKGKTSVKSIALDEGVIDAQGMIRISRNGSGTETHLKQDSLLLSKKARIHAVPGLQIETNDVKAGHGASITNLNDESLFYLTSRGIDKKTARKMLISGFAAEQLDKISDLPELKKTIQTLI